MAYYPYSKVKLSLLVSFIINIVMMTNAFKLNPTVNEYFISDLPQNTSLLNVHCQSRDDDLGIHTLNVGDKYDFSFHENFWGTTVFYCSFAWGPKSNGVDVYRRGNSLCMFKFLSRKDIYCSWLMKDSGIFFAFGENPSPSDFEFAYSWL
ncbi:hypothetical protein HAX54_008643 [Datura stramonium]|uniref:S-protein homolog n=1 Tax=Datura stramonium TaxID=4076 RepID=A0ABS8TG61_DATST|nr:hypothetical protein [Datura stramonium]